MNEAIRSIIIKALESIPEIRIELDGEEFLLDVTEQGNLEVYDVGKFSIKIERITE